MDGLQVYRKNFVKQKDLRREVLIKMATAAHNAEVRRTELNGGKASGKEMDYIAKYYEDLCLKGDSTR